MYTTAFVPAAAPALARPTRSAISVAPRAALNLPAPTRQASASAPAPSAARSAGASAAHGAPGAAGAGPRRVAVWVLADRRLEDNPALVEAGRAARAAGVGGACVPVFEGGVGEVGVEGLRVGLEGLGSGLVVVGKTGEGGAGVLEVVRRLKLDAVFYNRAVEEVDVTRQVAGVKVLEAAGVTVRGFWGNVLGEPVVGEGGEVRGVGEGYRALNNRKEVPGTVAAPRSLPRLPQGAGAVLGGGKVGVRAADILKGILKVGGRQGGAAVWALREALRAGVVSGRMVAERVVEVFGRFEGVVAGEVVWRDYVSAAVHAKLGAGKQAAVAV